MTRRSALAMFAAATQQPEIRVLLGGDVMLSRGVLQSALAHHDWVHPFRGIAPLFSEADIAFVNLESPFYPDPQKPRTDMVFRAPGEMAMGLKFAGIDVVSTANNHARDGGSKGLEFTLSVLREKGIACVGTGRDLGETHAGVVLTRKGVRFGFLAYTYDANNGNYQDTDSRIALMDISQMRTDVASLRQRADVVIVSMHAGWEYQSKPNPQQKAFAKAAVEAGGAVVVGHHPHVVQPWERIGDAAVFYSLGNLIFDQSRPSETKRGQIAELVFQGSALANVGVIEVKIPAGVPESPAGR